MTIVIRLAYTTVPLRSNDRLHWRAKAVQVRAIREVAYLAGLHLAEQEGPIDWPVVITLVWEVADRRVRDVGASAPTLKAAIDGLVDVGVLISDRHQVVTEERYRIEVGHSRGVRLEIDSVTPNHDAGSNPPASPPAHAAMQHVKSDLSALRDTRPDPSTTGTN